MRWLAFSVASLAASTASAGLVGVDWPASRSVGTYTNTRAEGDAATASLALNATASGTWQPLAAPAVATLRDLVFDGGHYLYAITYTASNARVARYDTLTDAWTLLSAGPDNSLAASEQACRITYLGGRLYTILRYGVDRSLVAYEIATDQWSTALASPLSVPYLGLFAGLDGNIYAEAPNWLYRYVPSTGVWSMLGAGHASGTYFAAQGALAGVAYSFASGNLYRELETTGALTAIAGPPATFTPTLPAVATHDMVSKLYGFVPPNQLYVISPEVASPTWARLPDPFPLSGTYNNTFYVPGLAVGPNGALYAHPYFASSGSVPFSVFEQVTDYASLGTYESVVLDTGGVPDYANIYWSATVPAGTTVRAQVATSTSASGPFVFVGPDGTAGTYYTQAAGQAIWSGHDNRRFAKVLMELATGSPTVSPKVHGVWLSNTVTPMRVSTMTPLPSGVVGTSYSQSLAAVGGLAPLTWTVVADAPPTGLGLSAGGVVSGTPSAGGTFMFTVRATDSSTPALTADKRLTVTVTAVAVAPVILENATLAAAVGYPYSFDADNRVTATGSAPITWTLVTGPSGFNLDTVTGDMTWTPSSAGNAAVTLRAQNAAGSDTYSFTIVVAAAVAAPVIDPTANLNATVGVAYRYDADNVATATGTAPITWSVAQGPVELTIGAATGFVDWTPTSAGAVGITLQATNAGGSYAYSFTVNVAAALAAPVIDETAALAGTVGTPYDYDADGRASATGSDPIVWSVVEGPAELSIHAATGAVSWVPTAAGAFDVTIRADNAAGYDTYGFSVNVTEALRAPVIDRTANGLAVLGEPYRYDNDYAASATGTGPMTWSVTQGPADLDIDADTGVVTWVPAAAGSVYVTLKAENVAGSDSYTFVVDVADVSAPVLCATVPATPALLSPDDGVARVSTRFTLLWLPVFGATLYEVEVVQVPVSGVPDFADPTARIENPPARVPNASYVATGVPGTTYAWRVTALDADGCASEASEIRELTTGEGSTELVAVARGMTVEEASSGIQYHLGPVLGPARLSVLYSAALSVPRVGYDVLSYEWDFGDGTARLFGPPTVREQTTHTFVLPAGYRTHLTAVDAGASAEAELQVLVTDEQGHVPPQADAVVTPSQVVAGEEVMLEAIVGAGSSPIAAVLWDLGDGQRSDASKVAHAYAQLGTYIVHLAVVDESGLWAEDFAAVTVTDAAGTPVPSVRVYANPPTGDVTDAALAVALWCDARGATGDAPTFAWDFGDGATDSDSNAAMLTHAYSVGPNQEREFEARCTVSNGTVSASDRVKVTLTVNGKLPPKIVSLPGATVCAGKAYMYGHDGRAWARGRDVLWRVGKVVGGEVVGNPTGFEIDPLTGIVSWTPSDEQVGAQDVVLLATNAAGSDAQSFTVAVTNCSPAPDVVSDAQGRGCGCRETGSSALGLLVGAVLLRRRRRHTP